MAKTPKLKRRKSDFGDRYRPITGRSSHPKDMDYIRRNIPCQWACPALTDIPGYIKAIFDEDFAAAYTINRKANLLPGILGRVCSRPCENFCRHGESDLGESVNICHLKRFAADSCQSDYHVSEKTFAQTDKTIAIVGGGPAGLAAANSLAIFGHRVTIYEAKPKLGGMLLYGIPDFRVEPELVDREIYNITRQGVQIQTNSRLGQDISLDQLNKDFDAVILALGCYQENTLNIPGENLTNVFSGLDFMIKVNEKDPYPVGKKVAVIGGGFTAMDCSRSSLRLGAKEVINFIRKTEEDLVVTKEEVFEAKKEGVKLVSLVSPIEILGTDVVSRVKFTRNRLIAAKGGKGKKPVQIEDSEFVQNADTVIIAIGQNPDLKPALNKKAKLKFNALGECSTPGLFLAGDCLNGASTVIEAIGHAQKVATRCDEYLIGRKRSQWFVSSETATDTTRERAWDFIPKVHMPTLGVPARFKNPDEEVETGYEDKEAHTESSRCYLCNLNYNIHIPDCIYCRWCIDLCPRNCIHMTADLLKQNNHNKEELIKTLKWNETAAIVIDSDRCIRCGECLRICPTQCIHVTKVGLNNYFIDKHTANKP